jgi:hypothetical protein
MLFYLSRKIFWLSVQNLFWLSQTKVWTPPKSLSEILYMTLSEDSPPYKYTLILIKYLIIKYYIQKAPTT